MCDDTLESKEWYISLHKMDYLQTVMLNVVKHLLQILRWRSVIDDVAPSVCERMTCSVNMYIITNKYDWLKRPPPWHVLCLFVPLRYAECIILNCFQYLRDTFLRFNVTEVHYTTPRRTWVFRERGVYSLLCVSGAPLMRVWGISRTSGEDRHRILQVIRDFRLIPISLSAKWVHSKYG